MNGSLDHANSSAVLGIDAAWTTTQPSGVALIARADSRWRLVSVQPSYASFVAAAHGGPAEWPPSGGSPDASRLLDACRSLHGLWPDVIAVDMPLSREPITSRRTSDNLVSKAYGGRHCATHTPSATRPGRISDDMTASFAAAGYPLATSSLPAHALVEVYPHPALVELARANRRLPYKISTAAKYWPAASISGRRAMLLEEWSRIVTLLDREVAGVAAALPPPLTDAHVRMLKAYEDQLDAVVCAWIGACILAGNALPFGDAVSAIWIPRPLPWAELAEM